MTEHGQHQVSSLVSDLVEMAEATRKLPQLEEQVRVYEAQHKADGERIAALEMRIIDYKNSKDELLAKLRSVEAERDEAGFRVLDHEEKIEAVVRILKGVRQEANDLIVNLTGSPKTDMVFMARKERQLYEGWQVERQLNEEARAKRLAEEAAHPTIQDSGTDLSGEPSSEGNGKPHWQEQVRDPVTGQWGPKVGQSADTPTVTSLSGSESQNASSPDVSKSNDAVLRTSAEAPEVAKPDPIVSSQTSGWGTTGFRPTAGEILAESPVSATGSDGNDPFASGHTVTVASTSESSSAEGKPYYRKLYIKLPTIVSLAEWLAGGGTEATYRWRPGEEVPQEAA